MCGPRIERLSETLVAERMELVVRSRPCLFHRVLYAASKGGNFSVSLSFPSQRDLTRSVSRPKQMGVGVNEAGHYWPMLDVKA